MRRRAAYAKSILGRGAASFIEATANREAAQVAFFLLMSGPALLLLLTWGFSAVLADDTVGDKIVTGIVDFLPVTDAESRQQVENLLDAVAAGAGGLGVVGAVALLYSASGAIGALRHALNEAFGGPDTRPFVPGKALDAGLTLLVAPTVIVALGLNLSGQLASAIGDRPWLNAAVNVVVTDVLPLVLVYAMLVLLFWLLPSSHAPLRAAWPGALVGILGVLLVKFGTDLYFSAVGRVNALYGTLGVLLAIVFSAYLTTMAVVYGAHVTAQATKPSRAPASGDPVSDDRGGNRSLTRAVLGGARGLFVRDRRRVP